MPAADRLLQLLLFVWLWLVHVHQRLAAGKAPASVEFCTCYGLLRIFACRDLLLLHLCEPHV
jgi:hypothetical protein